MEDNKELETTEETVKPVEEKVVADEEPVQESVEPVNEAAASEPVKTKAEIKTEKKLKKKQAKKDRRIKRKELRKQRKANWKGLPLGIRVAFRLMELILFGGIIAGIVAIFAGISFLIGEFIYYDSVAEHMNDPVDEEILLLDSPIDETQLANIDAMPGYDKNDTWAIYVYAVGSNLESDGEDDLADITKVIVADEVGDRVEEERSRRRSQVVTYVKELEQKGMELPAYMFYAQKPEEYSIPLYESVTLAEGEGCAYMDLEEMMMVDLPENIQIIVQTGGATRWSDSLINPNRSQRFIIDSKGFRELENNPIVDTCSPESLTDFLKFCKKDYEADHKVLILWDHGAGCFGYGSDEIYGNSTLTIADINEALSNVYSYNPRNPAFEGIGFDACLMGNLEVANALDGYGRYMYASEELEPGYGWDYYTWLQALADDTSVNGAKLGTYIVDSYVDYYNTMNENVSHVYGTIAVNMAVIDIHRASMVYDAYGEFCKEAMTKVAKDSKNISDVAKAATKSTRFGEYAYDIYNHIDLDGFLSYMPDDYSSVGKVRQLISETVLYDRSNSYLRDSTGLSVYFPVTISDYSGLNYMTEYINNVCVNDNIRALYYYKIGGCLNNDLTMYCIDNGIGSVKTLDIKPLVDFDSMDIDILEDNNVSIAVTDEMSDLMQDYYLSLAKYDDFNDRVTYFGADNYIYLDGEGNLKSDFDYEWICMNGVPLAVEIVSQNESSVQYRSEIELNGKDAYLSFTYDYDTESFAILGAVYSEDLEEADVLLKTDSVLKHGDSFYPVYHYTSMYTDDEGDYTGSKKIKYKKNSEIKMEKLDSGYYLMNIDLIDPRGDVYSSRVVEFDMSFGNPKNVAVNEDFYVIQTAD